MLIREFYLKKIRDFYDVNSLIKILCGLRRCGIFGLSGLNASSTPKWSTCGMEVRHSGPQVAEKCQLRAEMAEGGDRDRPFRGRSGIRGRNPEKRGLKDPEKATSAFAWKLPCSRARKQSGNARGATIAEFESNVYRAQRSIP